MTDALLSIIAGRDTEGYFDVRCLGRGGRVVEQWFPLHDHDATRRFVYEKSRALDVYVGAAPRFRRKGGKADIQHSWALWVDCDEEKSAGCVDRLHTFRPRPTIVVNSGSGMNCHAWWALSEPLTEKWLERANERLRYRLGPTLDKCSNLDRVLRPAGTLNHKHNPNVPVVVKYMTDSVYTVNDVAKNLADPPAKPPAKPRHDTHSDDPLLGVSAERYYTVLTGRPVGRGNVRCPFPAHHGGEERSPSMRLYDNGTFFCFGCSVGGSVFQFGAHLWNMGTRGSAFIELCDRLQHELGVVS